MRNNKFIALIVSVLTLTGCNAVAETFEKGAFNTQSFSENYYKHIPERYLSDTYAETLYDISDKITINEPLQNAFNDAIKSDLLNKNLSLKEAVELYGNDKTKSITRDDYSTEIEYMEAIFDSLSSPQNSKANFINYAANNNLSKGQYSKNVQESFKRGIFSKLTDGVIKCDGTGPKVRVQINEQGMGQTFDYELVNYYRFMFSVRGGSSIDYAKHGISRVTKAKVKINVSFFIEKSTTNKAAKHTLSFVVPEMYSDNEAIIYTNIISFDLWEILGPETLKRVNGLTISFELLEHAALKPSGVLNPAMAEEEFALMLYEVMLPYSFWR